jgi:hypothetical protein
MPLVMVIGETHLLEPHIYCDHCGDDIDDARHAHCLWDWIDDDARAETRLWFVHKDCDHLFTIGYEKRHKRHVQWRPLNDYLFQLVHNTHTDMDATRARLTDNDPE